jgi:RNA polymerase sigma factor (sigma-70 family)
VTGRTQSAGGDPVGADPDLDRRGLVEDNVALARHLARRFSGPHGVNQDIVQVAMLGLVEAAKRFDPAYGVPFAAFATRTILGELKRHRRDTAWNVHVARRVKEVALRLHRAVQALNDELGRSPTTEELANRLGVTVEACLEAMEARTADRQIVAALQLIRGRTLAEEVEERLDGAAGGVAVAGGVHGVGHRPIGGLVVPERANRTGDRVFIGADETHRPRGERLGSFVTRAGRTQESADAAKMS